MELLLKISHLKMTHFSAVIFSGYFLLASGSKLPDARRLFYSEKNWSCLPFTLYFNWKYLCIQDQCCSFLGTNSTKFHVEITVNMKHFIAGCAFLWWILHRTCREHDEPSLCSGSQPGWRPFTWRDILSKYRSTVERQTGGYPVSKCRA